MATKHTPGPWSVPHFARPEVGCSCGYVLSDTCMGAVATVHCSGDGDWLKTGDNPKFEEACANARLIAAAPELLDFAQQIFAAKDTGLLTLDTPADETLANVLSRGRAAILKATGGQS